MTRNLPQNLHPTAELLALLKIMGPDEAPALLTQLHADLMGCDNLIAMATPTCDWQMIRRASHNLIALAGTAGATALQQMAEDMNRIAHAEDRLAFAEIAPATHTALAGLADLIRSLAANRGRK